MREARLGRVVFVLQWFVLLMWGWVVIGRAALGVEIGWIAVVGIFYSVFIVPLLYLPPVLTLFDRESRRAGVVPRGYAIATLIVWAALFAMAFFVPDASDVASSPSWASRVLGLSDDASGIVLTVTFGVAALAWVFAVFYAIGGIAQSRAARQGPSAV